MNNATLLANYEKGLSAKGPNRNLYSKYASDFLAFSGGRFDRATLDRYIEHLKKNKMSDGTINFAFRVIRTLFNRNEDELKAAGAEWPYRRGEAPQIREDEVEAPALDPDCILDMIRGVRKSGDAADRAYLALSTVYGLRRVELTNIRADDIHLDDRTIHIATAKHGRERTHMIPDQIVPYLRAYDFDKPASMRGLLVVWRRAEHFAGMRHIKDVGWHSVRRTLDTLLLHSGIAETTVMSFMRWKQKTSSNMAFRYSAQTFVGRGEKTRKLGASFLKVDEEVFAKHPFLEAWA